MLIVQKYGGSSVADAAKIARVAADIAETYRAGNEVVAVLSAQGDTTDELLARAHEINPSPSGRELDMLLSVGEQISVALMAMQLEKMRLPAVSLTGWQIGLRTNAEFGAARIESVSAARIRSELERNRIVLVCGFQGVDGAADITTLGRGGSDTSAVAVAAALGADKCQICTDVEGVYTADPRKIPNAKKLDAIPYDEMLVYASLGNRVLHDRSVELAKRRHVELEVRSSFTRTPGTRVAAAVRRADRPPVCGVARSLPDGDAALVSVVGAGLPDDPGIAGRVFEALAARQIDILKVSSGALHLSVLVAAAEADAAVAAVHAAFFGAP
jgi:aspartate kinase